MNGKITTFFEDKGFGFITDENGDNRYFHIIKVTNPELIKKNAEVTFEPTTNNRGLSAFAIKVLPESKYIIIANEKIKITSIKSFNTFTQEVSAQAKIDKVNTVLSVGLLMNKIRPQNKAPTEETIILKMLSIMTYHNKNYIFSEDEIDIDDAIDVLKKI